LDKKIVGFRLKEEEFAFDIMKVVEIIRIKDITPVPTAPAFIEGVINLRGKIIPIIDLRKRFHLLDQERTKGNRIIIVEVKGKQLLGVIVDAVTHVVSVAESEILAPPPSIVSVGGKYIESIVHRGDDIIVFLDIDKVFSDEEHSGIKDMTGLEVEIEESPDR
jgi:purine-binding chemotaxis protein CheW